MRHWTRRYIATTTFAVMPKVPPSSRSAQPTCICCKPFLLSKSGTCILQSASGPESGRKRRQGGKPTSIRLYPMLAGGFVKDRLGSGRGAGFRPVHAPENSSHVFTLKTDRQSLQQLAKLSAGLFTSTCGHALRKLPPGLHGHRCPTSAGSLGDQGDELEALISTGSRRLQMSPIATFVIFCSTGSCCCWGSHSRLSQARDNRQVEGGRAMRVPVSNPDVGRPPATTTVGLHTIFRGAFKIQSWGEQARLFDDRIQPTSLSSGGQDRAQAMMSLGAIATARASPGMIAHAICNRVAEWAGHIFWSNRQATWFGRAQDPHASRGCLQAGRVTRSRPQAAATIANKRGWPLAPAVARSVLRLQQCRALGITSAGSKSWARATECDHRAEHPCWKYPQPRFQRISSGGQIPYKAPRL